MSAFANGVIPKDTIAKLKFDLEGDSSSLEKNGSHGTASYSEYLDGDEKKRMKHDPNFKGFQPIKPGWFPTGDQTEGPFEMTPDLAQVRIVHSVGMVMDGGAKASAEILWPNIVSSIADKELREKLKKLSAVQSLPASVKIAAASVGDNVAYRDMCHVKVFDGTKEHVRGHSGEVAKLMNTQHLYKKTGASSEPVGYPLHLLTEEGGFVLEEPPQLTDTFKHYWYISNSMLTSSAYKQESSTGTYISIPKNSDAARLMYYVLVIKNGAGAADPSANVTKLNAALFEESFNDANDQQSWRFPEVTFTEVTALLQRKLNDVREKSFNCESIKVEIAAFDIFREHILAGKGKIPVLITLEVDLHLPLVRDAVETEIGRGAAHGGKHAPHAKKQQRHVEQDFGEDDE